MQIYICTVYLNVILRFKIHKSRIDELVNYNFFLEKKICSNVNIERERNKFVYYKRVFNLNKNVKEKSLKGFKISFPQFYLND